MHERDYKIKIKRRRGRWVAYAPELPNDSPRVELDKLSNVDMEMIVQIAGYLGVSTGLVSVTSRHPTRPARVPLRSRLSMGALQLGGVGVAVSGLYLAAGAAATLIAAGIAVVAAATGKEAGWL